MSRRHSIGRSVQCSPEDERRFCDVYNAGRDAKAAKANAKSASLKVQALVPVGNIKVHHLEAQGGTKAVKKSMLEYVMSTNCDTAFSVAFGRRMSIDDLQPAVKYIANKLQNSTAKKNKEYTHLECYVEHQEGNSHLHCLLTFDNELLRVRYAKLFPIDKDKCGILSRLWGKATYDSKAMRNRQATISYAAKLQHADADWDSKISSRDLFSTKQ